MTFADFTLVFIFTSDEDGMKKGFHVTAKDEVCMVNAALFTVNCDVNSQLTQCCGNVVLVGPETTLQQQ